MNKGFCVHIILPKSAKYIISTSSPVLNARSIIVCRVRAVRAKKIDCNIREHPSTTFL
jgi:hypothetical protein